MVIGAQSGPERRGSPEKAMRNSLSLREQGVRTIMRPAVIVCGVGSGTPVLSVSAGFTDLTGYTPAELLGGSLSVLQGPGTDQAAIDLFRHLISHGRSGTIEILNYRKDGTPFWMRCRLQAIHGTHGKPTHFIGRHTLAGDLGTPIGNRSGSG